MHGDTHCRNILQIIYKWHKVDMDHRGMCWEKSFLTLLVGICGFNLVEKAVSYWESKIDQVLIYIGMLFSILIYIYTVHGTEVCNMA
jgi:hypothetical protein